MLLLIWIIAIAVVVIAVIGSGFYRDYQLLKLLQPPGTPVGLYRLAGRNPSGLVLIGVLVSGVVLELCHLRWAWVINCGIYSIAFLATAWHLARYHVQHAQEHPQEEFLVLIFILIPSGIAATVTIFLYWFSRRESESHPDHVLV